MGCKVSRAEVVPEEMGQLKKSGGSVAHNGRASGASNTSGKGVKFSAGIEGGKGDSGDGKRKSGSSNGTSTASVDIAGTFSRKYSRKENQSLYPHSQKVLHNGERSRAISKRNPGTGGRSMARSLRAISQRIFGGGGGGSSEWILRRTPPIKSDYQFMGVVGRGQFGQVYGVKPLHQQAATSSNSSHRLSVTTTGAAGAASSASASATGAAGATAAAAGATSQSAGGSSGIKYACKTLNKRKLLEQLDPDDIRKEIEVMYAVTGHELVVGLQRCYEDEKNVYMVMDLCHGDLFEVLRQRKYLPEWQAVSVMRQALRSVQYCHTLGVIHRDIKPENFLLAAKGDLSLIKLTDFGLSTFYVEGQTFSELLGSPYYIAPEVIRQAYGVEADVWSCGVMLYILLCGEAPFYGEGDEGIFRAIMKAKLDFSFDPWPSISEEAKDLIRRMLVKDVSQRATLEEALSHPWFTEEHPQPQPPPSRHISASSSLAQSISRMVSARDRGSVSMGPGAEIGMNVLREGEQYDPIMVASTTGEDGRYNLGAPEPVLYRRLKAYGMRSRVSKLVQAFIVGALPSEMTYGASNLFTDFDAGADKVLDAMELQDGLARRGTQVTQEQAEALLEAADLDGDGQLSELEWSCAVLVLGAAEHSCRLAAAWTLLDPDSDGLADPSYVAEVLGLVNMLITSAGAGSSQGGGSSISVSEARVMALQLIEEELGPFERVAVNAGGTALNRAGSNIGAPSFSSGPSHAMGRSGGSVVMGGNVKKSSFSIAGLIGAGQAGTAMRISRQRFMEEYGDPEGLRPAGPQGNAGDSKGGGGGNGGDGSRGGANGNNVSSGNGGGRSRDGGGGGGGGVVANVGLGRMLSGGDNRGGGGGDEVEHFPPPPAKPQLQQHPNARSGLKGPSMRVMSVESDSVAMG